MKKFLKKIKVASIITTTLSFVIINIGVDSICGLKNVNHPNVVRIQEFDKKITTKEEQLSNEKLYTITLDKKTVFYAAPPSKTPILTPPKEDKKKETVSQKPVSTIKPTVNLKPTLENQIDKDELRHMSAIIFAEAGNQCQAGQQAVGIVIMERVKCEKYFKDDVISVIYEPGQFTPVKNGHLNKALKKYDSGKLPESCIEAAKYALNGNTIVNYNGKKYDLKGYLFFGRYIKNRKLVIQDHDFK